MAGAHGQQAGVGAGLLQIAVRPGHHVGVAALKQLAVELIAVCGHHGVLGIGIGKARNIPGLPLVHPLAHNGVLGLQSGLARLIQALGVPTLEHGQGHGQVVLLIFGGQGIKDAALESIRFHALNGRPRVCRLGVDIQVDGHGVVAAGLVQHGQGVEGIGQHPGLEAGHLRLGHAHGGQGLHHLLIQLPADMVLQRGPVGVGLHGGKLVDSRLVVEVQLKGGQLGAGDDVPQLFVEGVEVAAVGVDGAQQVEGVAVALRFPQKPQRAGVALVVKGQDHAVGKGRGLQQSAGAVQSQTVAIAVDHAQAGQKLNGAGIYPRKSIGEGFHI